MIRYRPKGRKQQRAAIGTYPGIRLKRARARAMEIIAAAQQGRDLLDDQRKARMRAEAESRTLADAVEAYIENYAKPNQRRWNQTQRVLQAYIVPEIGDRRLVDLKRGDLSDVLDNMQKRGKRTQVNAARRFAVMALNWVVEEKGWLETNPFAGIPRRKALDTEEGSGRKLADHELGKIWFAADRIGGAGGDFVKVLMLSGQRRDEVRCLPRTEVKPGEDWVLPKARNKGKRDHIVPLAQMARSIIDARPHFGPYVFTLSGKKPYRNEVRLKRQLDRESGVTGWKYHDLRRACASGMAALGVPQEVIDRVLNHSKGKLAGTYNLHDYLKEKREALEKWAVHIAAITSENVIELKRA